jgi:hypothetical protein
VLAGCGPVGVVVDGCAPVKRSTEAIATVRVGVTVVPAQFRDLDRGQLDLVASGAYLFSHINFTALGPGAVDRIFGHHPKKN